MPDPDSRATMLRAAQHFKLTHYEVQRLAIRMLADSCGIPLRSIAPVR